jgi:excisionase family DNA binding protein
MTVQEAAERLGVSVSLVYSLCARRLLRHERHGLGRGVIRIPEDAIDEYRRSATVSSAAPVGPMVRKPAPPPVTLKHLRLRGGG